MLVVKPRYHLAYPSLIKVVLVEVVALYHQNNMKYAAPI